MAVKYKARYVRASSKRIGGYPRLRRYLLLAVKFQLSITIKLVYILSLAVVKHFRSSKATTIPTKPFTCSFKFQNTQLKVLAHCETYLG